MPESAEEVYARVVAAVGADGRLPMPPVGEWDVFPWEIVEGELQPKVLQPPGDEPTRWGESDDKPCGSCAGQHPELRIWQNERWFVTRADRPSGLPLLLWLHPVEHLDLSDLSDEMAAEQGRISTWLARIMGHLPHIGRVHVCRWGDGSAHLHWWFIARTARLPQILGSMAIEWEEMLPPGPEDVWRADYQAVARRLATHDGHALA
jgi:diadenosine tetraphosphate (Ap4A) HIT family hydrolase